MGFLIDTCIWIDIERGTLAPADVQGITHDEPVYLSPITIAELKFGVEITQNQSIRQKRLMALKKLMTKPTLRIDETTGEIFGDLAAQLVKKGGQHHHRIQDLWLASQAIQHNLKLLTHNLKDFQDIPGIEIATLPRGVP